MSFKGRRLDRPKQTARKTTGGSVGAYSFAEDEDEDLEQDDDEDEEQEVILAHSVCSAACDTGPIDTAMFHFISHIEFGQSQAHSTPALPMLTFCSRRLTDPSTGAVKLSQHSTSLTLFLYVFPSYGKHLLHFDHLQSP